MSVSPCNLVNSVIMRNMEILIKMSFLMVIILTAIMIILFYCFQMSLYICKGQCRSLSRTHKFQSLSNNILKQFSIKALVLVLSWDSLGKNDIELTLQQMYIHIQKNIVLTKTFFELLDFQDSWNLIGSEKLGMPDQNHTEALNEFVTRQYLGACLIQLNCFSSHK